jgi:hypothetical protein
MWTYRIATATLNKRSVDQLMKSGERRFDRWLGEWQSLYFFNVYALFMYVT